jgi:hypothetical protein
MPYLVPLAGSNPANLSGGLEKLLRYAVCIFFFSFAEKCMMADN